MVKIRKDVKIDEENIPECFKGLTLEEIAKLNYANLVGVLHELASYVGEEMTSIYEGAEESYIDESYINKLDDIVVDFQRKLVELILEMSN